MISEQLPLLGNLEHLDALKRLLAKDKIEVLILDPAYLCIPAEGHEGSLFAMGQLLRGLSEMCQSLGVTLVLAHHTKRGVADPFAPPELEDIAWAGFQEFARQWLLLGRRERYEAGTGTHRLWMNVGGSAGHSSMWALDVEEGVFDGTTPRTWNVTISKAEDARREARDREQADKQEKRREKERAQRELDKAAVIEAAGNPIEGDTISSLRDRSGVRTERFQPILAELLKDEKLVPTRVKKNKRWYDGYRLKPDESETPERPKKRKRRQKAKSPEPTEGDQASA